MCSAAGRRALPAGARDRSAVRPRDDLGVARLADARPFRRGEGRDGRRRRTATSKSRNRVSSAAGRSPSRTPAPAVAGHCRGPPRRRPGRRTTPLVRDQAQPQGVVAGHLAGADPGQFVVGGLGQQPSAERGGQQVRRRGQRERRGLGAGGGGPLVLPGPGAALVVVGAGLAGGGDDVDPVVRGPRHQTRISVRSLNRSARWAGR